LLLNKKELKMETPSEIKIAVKERYASIAKNSTACGCGCSGSSAEKDYVVMQDDYSGQPGYDKDADLQLGCGIPTNYAGIKKGDTVVDLGSGAGNDVFVARALVGDEGKVIGIDMTDEMIEKARKNNAKNGYGNVEFKFGEIEQIPLEDNIADVVISNCVLNLVPDKKKAFSEIYRILKPGAHFCVSDIVIRGEMPAELKKSAEMYAGCISGALSQEEYLESIKLAGFTNVEIKKSVNFEMSEELLNKYLTESGLKEYKEKFAGLYSITAVGYK
jgi:ubiquinone/menaquinone biosynthesis C-methylase UbiE